MFLDAFLHEIHQSLFKKMQPDFSVLFLNAGAHIQHHYFFNSSYVENAELVNPSWYIDHRFDPFREMLQVYDEILTDLLALPDTQLMVSTGLSQSPFTEKKFMYRLRDHDKFLRKLGLDEFVVTPRMTQDFLMSFETSEKCKVAEKLLVGVSTANDVPLFGEVDNRGTDLFVVLTYPSELTEPLSLKPPFGHKLDRRDGFRVYKNGEHNPKGYAFLRRNRFVGTCA